MHFSSSLPMHYKCDLSQPIGVGDKLLLRKVAQRIGGIQFAQAAPKRAIQFGSKSAKIYSTKERGTDKIQEN